MLLNGAAADHERFGDREVVAPLAAATVLAVGAWICELGVLWLAVAAVGHPLPLAAIAVGLGAANAAAAVPHTPGGVGVVEVAMTAAFVAAGVDAGAALGGVIGYRVIGFWLPVAIGATLLGIDVAGARLRTSTSTRAQAMSRLRPTSQPANAMTNP